MSQSKSKVIKLGPEEDPRNIDWIIEAQKKRSRENGVPTDAELAAKNTKVRVRDADN